MDRELERRWVLQWIETGKLLDEIRRRELREMTEEQARAASEDAARDRRETTRSPSVAGSRRAWSSSRRSSTGGAPREPRLRRRARYQEFCRGEGWRFCFIGRIAVQRWGEPRLTQDVDLTLLTGFGEEGPVLDRLLANASRGGSPTPETSR